MSTDVVSLRVSDATYVNSSAGKTTTIFATTAKSVMSIRSGTQFAIINWSLPRDFRARTTTAAPLEVTLDAPLANGMAISARRSAQPPGKSLAKVNSVNAPGFYAGSAAVAGALKAGTTSTYVFQVATEMQKVAAGDDWWGFQISTTDTTVRRIQGATTPNYPRLTLTLTDGTPAPDVVSPNGLVSVKNPAFVWSSPNDIVSIQAQADAVGGTFANPAWDSGQVPGVPTASAQMLLSGTVANPWAGLADGASADLRFRQVGPLGASPWSATITVTRRVLGALTTNLPAAGGTTNDPTPQHAWTFANQASFRLWLTNLAGQTVYDSDRIPGADQAFTPPAAKVAALTDLTQLTSHLQVWDNVPGRVSSPGDLAYVQADWSWTVAPDSATSPFDTVTVTPLYGGCPGNRLTLTRASGAPDEILVVRDGVILSRFDGTLNQTSSTTWQIVDWTAAPRSAHTYGVAAIVSNKASNRLTATLPPQQITGLWVYHVDTGANFSLADPEVASQLEYAESSLIYTPIYATAPIKKTMALRGLEGPSTGFLRDFAGRSINQQLADIWIIRANPSSQCRVIFGAGNTPALISNLSPVIDADATPDVMQQRVSMRIDQVGELPAMLPAAAL